MGNTHKLSLFNRLGKGLLIVVFIKLIQNLFLHFIICFLHTIFKLAEPLTLSLKII